MSIPVPKKLSYRELRSLGLFFEPHSRHVIIKKIMNEIEKFDKYKIKENADLANVPNDKVVYNLLQDIAKFLSSIKDRSILKDLHLDPHGVPGPYFLWHNDQVNAIGYEVIMLYNMAIILLRDCFSFDIEGMMVSKSYFQARLEKYFLIYILLDEVKIKYPRSRLTHHYNFPDPIAINILQHFCKGMCWVTYFYQFEILTDKTTFNNYDEYRTYYSDLACLSSNIYFTFSDVEFMNWAKNIKERKPSPNNWELGYFLVLYYADYLKIIFRSLSNYFIATSKFPLETTITYDRIIKPIFGNIPPKTANRDLIKIDDPTGSMKFALYYIQKASAYCCIIPQKTLRNMESFESKIDNFFGKLTSIPSNKIISLTDLEDLEKSYCYKFIGNLISAAKECLDEQNRIYHVAPIKDERHMYPERLKNFEVLLPNDEQNRIFLFKEIAIQETNKKINPKNKSNDEPRFIINTPIINYILGHIDKYSKLTTLSNMSYSSKLPNHDLEEDEVIIDLEFGNHNRMGLIKQATIIPNENNWFLNGVEEIDGIVTRLELHPEMRKGDEILEQLEKIRNSCSLIHKMIKGI